MGYMGTTVITITIRFLYYINYYINPIQFLYSVYYLSHIV